MSESARVWTIIVAAINAIGEKWMSRAVSENDIRTICAECSAAMRRIADEERHDLTGWGFHVEGSITLIAVNPGGRGFDMVALANGGYSEAERFLVREPREAAAPLWCANCEVSIAPMVVTGTGSPPMCGACTRATMVERARIIALILVEAERQGLARDAGPALRRVADMLDGNGVTVPVKVEVKP